MKLRELEARFVRYEVTIGEQRFIKPAALARGGGPYTDDDIETRIGSIVTMPTVDMLADAHGVLFLCPKCYVERGGPVGTHAVLCWFAGKVPPDAEPLPGRWTPEGTGLDDLTFVPDGGRSNSVLLLGGCGWHGLVARGEAA